MLQIIPNKKYFFIFSGTLIIASILALAIWGLNLGIDFKGGSEIKIKFDQQATKDDVVNVLRAKGFDASARSYAQNAYLVSMRSLSAQEHQAALKILEDKFVKLQPQELSFESIGPSIGKELRQKAIISVILVLIGISLYIAWAFRKVSKPVSSWKYGLATLVALFHDVIIPIGVFTVVGKLLGWEIDSNFIVALLVVMGFSVHDTIVVFDRIRENLKTKTGQFADIVNMSVNQTMARSINTSLTTLIVLAALFTFGDPAVKLFVFTLLIGIAVGTYSSIFIASPILVQWQPKPKKLK